MRIKAVDVYSVNLMDGKGERLMAEEEVVTTIENQLGAAVIDWIRPQQFGVRLKRNKP